MKRNFIALFFLFTVLAGAVFAASELNVFLNNKSYLGPTFCKGDEVFLELSGLERLYPEKADYDKNRELVIFDGQELTSTTRKNLEGRDLIFISARELTRLFQGKYNLDKKNGILDLYTFAPANAPKKDPSAKEVKHFLARYFHYPEVVQKASALLGTEMGLSIKDYVLNVQFVPKAWFAKAGKKNAMGLTLFYKKDRDIEILVVIAEDLERGTQLGTITHEFAHVWHYLNARKTFALTTTFTEGFAEWASYRCLESLDYLQEMEDKEHNLYIQYRKGLSMFLQLEEKYGRENLIKKVAEGRELKL